ncbi:16S rRNA (guanine(527)-N(7))-methyltransferase RsmG [Piscinibacter sakaiensis]|uniref:Ribosomal RNA small subunit methyltransferase G n=1 Tax=Piscinibacter sakaiensis TaxID=1547922 RepID=A0A0K8NXH2_PISS1|nr:16S rRNA (guanine(527)-N(7))-methyltransferase RsmG [Piscinibacter sakaiensis]GAP35073.1 rRNA small subunit methyltransferase [Piscinibacter sakaiensis]
MPPESGQSSPAAELARLQSAAAQLGLEPSPEQYRAWLGHLDLVAKWNRVYNLTAIRDRQEMLSQHLVDCLAVLRPLQRHLEQLPALASPPRVLDVGSGAGFPGVVIAIGLPAASVCCVDTVGKKASFLTQVAAELGLSHLRGLHARVEELAPQQAQVITSRAFASLADFVALTRRHLADNGVWLAMKGRRPDDEVAALPGDIEVFHVEPLQVPGLDAQRCLVWMRPRP